jgi:hypothetical protein
MGPTRGRLCAAAPDRAGGPSAKLACLSSADDHPQGDSWQSALEPVIHVFHSARPATRHGSPPQLPSRTDPDASWRRRCGGLLHREAGRLRYRAVRRPQLPRSQLRAFRCPGLHRCPARLAQSRLPGAAFHQRGSGRPQELPAFAGSACGDRVPRGLHGGGGWTIHRLRERGAGSLRDQEDQHFGQPGRGSARLGFASLRLEFRLDGEDRERDDPGERLLQPILHPDRASACPGGSQSG